MFLTPLLLFWALIWSKSDLLCFGLLVCKPFVESWDGGPCVQSVMATHSLYGPWERWLGLNTLRPRQNGRHFADDTFKRIFLNENVRISIKISLKFVPMGPINIIPALVQIMAWRRSGDKALSEPMMVSLLTHICVTLPQWVKPFICWVFVVFEEIWNVCIFNESDTETEQKVEVLTHGTERAM